LNIRVLLLLLLLTALICGAVLLTDRFSYLPGGRKAAPAATATMEHRRDADATVPATAAVTNATRGDLK
jgi:hypothetical protein